MALAPNPNAPATIGPFRVISALGNGAMGVVYLGERMEQFTQRVAIKMLHPHVSLLLGQQSLQHEEKVLTSLDHEAIVRLLDTGQQADGTYYIVMEYVDGLPLDRYCDKAMRSQTQRLQLLLEIARAIDYAHRRLIIHADLKPENILITPTGKPRILDFGVAILLDGSAQSDTAVSRQYTPAYASPEQLSNRRITPATDIYSLGKMARSLLSNDGHTAIRLSKDLNAILSKATETEPQQRYATINAFADDMKAVLEHRPVAARNGRHAYRFGHWVRRHWAAATIAGTVAVVLIASATGVTVQTVRATRERTRAQTQLADVTKLTGVLAGELYDSEKGLPRAKAARITLLDGATQTLDSLSKMEGQDPKLSLEMARQYELLAQLELDEAAGSLNAVRARHDADQAQSLLTGAAAKDAVTEAEMVRVKALQQRIAK